MFRFACTAKGLDLSEGLEASITKWLELEGVEVVGKTVSTDQPRML